MGITKGEWKVKSRWLVVDEHGKIIANLQTFCESSKKIGFEESEINAHFIAASPIMYDFIKGIADSGDVRAIKIISEITIDS